MESYDIHQARIEQSIDDLRARRDQLIAEIQTVFKDVELGDGITLCEANVIDDYGTAEERARARETDQHIYWAQVDLDDVDPGASALCLLMLSAFVSISRPIWYSPSSMGSRISLVES